MVPFLNCIPNRSMMLGVSSDILSLVSLNPKHDPKPKPKYVSQDPVKNIIGLMYVGMGF